MEVGLHVQLAVGLSRRMAPLYLRQLFRTPPNPTLIIAVERRNDTLKLQNIL